ncbi:hypothetical protein H0486_10435 [Lachnospiraceae bacterium MD1]|uniref:Alpha/beta hydrolase n=1 Tax=Variimorphobacter saccharofermentans TaxID=2755051 RepID=A0A839K100_9FIRM|nr:hypothetical protein [Variimorphobacter saccharofermentans]MBB2183296.1 hypothetical protein [Variimorphobacter saccharofermentans]
MKSKKRLFLIIFICFLLFTLDVLVCAYIIPPGKQYNYESQYLKENKTDFIDINGCKIHYLQKGEGEPLILIHGGAAWLYSFRNNIDEHKISGHRLIIKEISIGA